MIALVLARKPPARIVAANVQQHGTGTINIDGCRVGFAGEGDEQEAKKKNRHVAFGSGPKHNNVFGEFNKDREDYTAPGRWPANLLLADAAAKALDEQSGFLTPCGSRPSPQLHRTWHDTGFGSSSTFVYGDGGGGASRFFKVFSE